MNLRAPWNTQLDDDVDLRVCALCSLLTTASVSESLNEQSLAKTKRLLTVISLPEQVGSRRRRANINCLKVRGLARVDVPRSRRSP
jgi:hypothetical protein